MSGHCLTGSTQAGFHSCFHRAQPKQHTKLWVGAQKLQHIYSECWACLTFLVHETHSCALTLRGVGKTRTYVSFPEMGGKGFEHVERMPGLRVPELLGWVSVPS